jgi:pyruvate-formate lyase-activating enzyme
MQGFLDSAFRGHVKGWAWDAGRPDAALTIEVFLNGTLVGEVTADRFRADLKSEGIGTGQYGFELQVPLDLMSSDSNSVEARIAQTGQGLSGSPLEMEQPRFIEYFAGDIVDNCNLRCPFCLVNYENVRVTNRIEERTFLKWTQIMPAVLDGSFYISCLHEATLHPRVYDFIEMIPEDVRKKVFFTSNLCKPIKDADIERLAKSNIHHLNVSMDTMDDNLFSVLRKGGRLKIFEDNLRRLSAAFKESDRAPELRFITMAYRTNLEEIPSLIEQAYEELGGSRYEVRYTYNVRHITDAFRTEHFLSRDGWKTLEDSINALGYPSVDVVLPPDDYEKAYVRSTNYWVMPDEEGFPAEPPARPIALRGAWDGTVRVRKREEHFSVNVNILEDPAAFFLAI